MKINILPPLEIETYKIFLGRGYETVSYYLAEVGFELRNLPVSASQNAGVTDVNSTPGLKIIQ